MKRFNFFSILFISIFILTIGCNSSKSKRPVTKISIEKLSNKTLEYGKNVKVNLNYQSKASELNKIEFYIDNQLFKTVKEKENTLEIEAKNLLPGNHTLKTIASTTKGKKGTNYKTFMVVSDIVPKEGTFELIETLTHNTENFTQGFEFYKGKLYEGTGNYNESKLVIYNPDNKKIFKEKDIEKTYFGEGITIFNNKLYQLTYKAQKVLVYDAETLERINEFNFDSKEGWGLTHNEEHLIMSDGSHKLFFIDPETFKTVYTINVTTNKNVIQRINELEYVDGYIYANVWLTQTIIKIEASTGRVITAYNMNDLIKDMNSYHTDVLNGIAYNPENELFYLTGKYYPSTFKVKFSE